MSAWPNPTPPDRWRPDPARQQRADYQVADLSNLPDDDSPRVELVDGALQVTPFPTLDHQDISGLLRTWLRCHAPADIRATQAVAVELGDNTSRRPDVLLCRADVPSDRSTLRPQDVVLAVEIVSPGTRRIDRFAKPGEYAAAGIPFYWRIEQDPVHVYAYRIGDRVGPGGERQYELVADGPDVIELTEPFDIKLPIAEITP
ncbi:Uma2 family endonuclease [Micromonospora sp. D93]|uniref:Uma2 family endonuclease n=1 Tax=Micromonospora sp. D93 TaxID=2824886 RepID=UPI001B38FDBE|nr:Uma2 family endonuclease [Micromonospora sp. D93]MBQ1022372.1 Uma2 family endonuclease [Micromonospora sp. D93]